MSPGSIRPRVNMTAAFFRTLNCLILTSITAFAEEPPEINYQVTFDHRAQHFAHIEMTIPATVTGRVEVVMPVWTPGSYLVREYARHIDQLVAADEEQTPLEVTRGSRDRWVINAEGKEGTIRVSYRLYCRELSVRTNWVDSQMAILNGAATFLTVPELRNRKHRVSIVVPERWQVATALEKEDESYIGETFEQLVDSPIVAAPLQVSNFEVGDTPHRLVHFGDASLWGTTRSVEDVKKIVAAHQKFWGCTPYPHYTFLNAIVESRGGLEHDNSTLLMTGRFSSRDPEKYEDWLSLVSHEFFHTWNVRRLRPVELRHYDLQNENYTRSLWVAEGITSYYEDLLLVRAGVLRKGSWLKRLSKDIAKLQQTPGRLQQSLSDSSYDTWIKFYRPHENSRNVHVSYYTKGAVVAFLLDARIREITGNRKSLDDVMRKLYEQFVDTGYSPEDFGKTCSDVAGRDMTEWLAEHVEQASELDYEPALKWYGLTFDPPAKPVGATEAGKKKIWLGAEFESAHANPVFSRIRSDGPAAAAGINVGDELIAVNDIRSTKSGIEKQLQQYAVGETLDLLIARRGRLRHLEMKATAEPKQKWQLRPLAGASGYQKLRLDSLLK